MNKFTQEVQTRHRERIRSLEGALLHVALWFGEYERHHEAKGDVEKAERNRARKGYCQRAADTTSAPVLPPEIEVQIREREAEILRLQADFEDCNLHRAAAVAGAREAERIFVALQMEVEALKLAILGGEDAPGFAATVPTEQVIEALRHERADHVAEVDRARASRRRFAKALQNATSGLKEIATWPGRHDMSKRAERALQSVMDALNGA